ncbi:MAG TPA: 3-methyl-2-oxobutanoate dehydrogenase subunit VorB [Candidatus Udaeobacter sp.]|nr:3-methyl-2-oxobutanoate dehydrogenase subunit VorB [Candidatus Udaeobacter sp.]
MIKGNEAAVHGALLAGCRYFFGYPITPASEIAHEAARLFPAVGGVFVQAESETAAINMVYGAASTGVRVLTASSGPGISLKQEGISYAAGAELPLVLIDIMRGGPGLGNIGPEQADYFQMVKGGGHGSYRVIVLAPASAQEMCDLTQLAFELSDRYRNPACILADGTIGQMMEPVAFPAPAIPPADPSWAIRGDHESAGNLISSIYLEHQELEAHIRAMKRKYDEIELRETRYQGYRLEDAAIVLVAYGIVSRIALSAVDAARARGIQAGLLRPITLWPFPSRALAELADRAHCFLTLELSTGQMVEDVRLAVSGRRPVLFYGRSGGVLPTVDEILTQIEEFGRKVEGGIKS